jgi:hypothetical protein
MTRKNINKKQTKLKINSKLLIKYLTFGLIHFAVPALAKAALTIANENNIPIGKENIDGIVKTVDKMILIASINEMKLYHENKANRK